MPKPKKANESLTVMTEMIFPNDTNTLGNLMGGNLMRLLDIAGAIAAQKHCNRIVVTASVDNVQFKEAIPLGSVVTLQAKVTRAFNSSLEVVVEVWAENIPAGTKIHTNKAFLTKLADRLKYHQLSQKLMKKKSFLLERCVVVNLDSSWQEE
jgi:acyl-CoA hydrolase